MLRKKVSISVQNFVEDLIKYFMKLRLSVLSIDKHEHLNPRTASKIFSASG